MDDAGWERFAEDVLGYFSEIGQEIEILAGVVFVGGDRERPRNLGNLAASCASKPSAEWPAAIRRHFREIDEAVRDSEELNAGKKSFEDVRSQLLLRIYDEASTPFTDQLYMRHDLEGTDTFVVVDMPTSVTHLNRASSRHWGKTDEELFRVAEENLRARPLPQPAVMRGAADEPVYVFQGDFFTSSHVLLREVLDAYVGPFGAYVAIPFRELLVVCPLERPVPDTFIQLGMFVAEQHSKSPGAISPFMFWYYQGQFERCGSGPNHMTDMKPFVPERLRYLFNHQA